MGTQKFSQDPSRWSLCCYNFIQFQTPMKSPSTHLRTFEFNCASRLWFDAPLLFFTSPSSPSSSRDLFPLRKVRPEPSMLAPQPMGGSDKNPPSPRNKAWKKACWASKWLLHTPILSQLSSNQPWFFKPNHGTAETNTRTNKYTRKPTWHEKWTPWKGDSYWKPIMLDVYTLIFQACRVLKRIVAMKYPALHSDDFGKKKFDNSIRGGFSLQKLHFGALLRKCWNRF